MPCREYGKLDLVPLVQRPERAAQVGAGAVLRSPGGTVLFCGQQLAVWESCVDRLVCVADGSSS